MRVIPESELIINADGSAFHLHLKPEQLADRVVLVGDPDRVSTVASYFDTQECEVSSREFHTITGTYKGKRITVVSHGIGTDNIDIVLNELDALANIDFSTRTGCDSLAISIGTSHGAYKFKPEQCTRDPKTGRLVPPPLAFDILHEIEEKLPGFPIVLHGSSSVPEEYVKIIDQYGGNLPNAVGIPEEQLREASKSAVCKINIDSDSRLAYTAGVRETLAQHPDYFDPRQYGKVARKYMTEMYSHKIIDVLGSDHKLINCD